MRDEISRNPLVSCLIANHNKGRWIFECLESLANQTYQPLEIVVCENGSTDASPEIVRGFERHPGFRCIYHPVALGFAGAVNLMLPYASGEYIAMLGADDVAKPNHLELVMNCAIKDPDADIVYGDFETINASGLLVSKERAGEGRNYIFDKCSIGHGTGVTKKSVYDELGGYDENLKLSVDWEFILRAIKAGKKLVYCGETGCQWRRVHDGQSMTMKYGKQSQVRIESHSYIRRKYGLAGPCQCGCGAVA